jgi:hypothetical protein
MDILVLLENANDEVRELMSNPLASFGPPSDPYLGLSMMMPERLVDLNQYTEERISYKTFVANNGTKYSPVQLKGGAYVGSFKVETTSSDIGGQLKAQDYEAIVKILAKYTGSEIPMQALMNYLRWVDKTLLQPLNVKNERMIWENVVDAEVQIEGDDGFKDSVKISAPDGHRVASGDWTDPAYDPMIDIYGRADLLKSKGLRPKFQFAPSTKINQVLNHPKVIQNARGFITIDAGELKAANNRLTLKGFNDFLAENELPPVIKYDKTYNVQNAPARHYLKRDAWVMIGETENTEEIPVEDDDLLILESTLGYTAVGRNAGYTDPGKMTKITAHDGKGPHFDGEAWQESFPVNQNPEAPAVLTDIPD